MDLVKNNFVVITTARSGSTWLMDTLNRVAGLKVYGELFLPETADGQGILSTDYPRFIDYVNQCNKKPGPLATISYLRGLFAQQGSVGFKLMYSQLRRHPEILPFLLVKNIRIVHLIRKNQLDTLISEQRARASGTDHLRAGETEQGPVRFAIDVDQLIPRLARIRNAQTIARRVIATLPVAKLEVSYEDLSTAGDAWHRLFAFLRLDENTTPPQSGLTKRGGQARAQDITNWEDVERSLTSSEFRELLE